MPASPLPRLQYSATLDGLRAIAVIVVIGYHLDISWMRGGFLGVDLFFVISGFLITRLLLDEHAHTGEIGLGGFWIRRFRRLVPPLVVVIAASIGATLTWGLPAQIEALRGDAIASLLYVANWRFISDGTSYFETLAGPSPLRHIWSLAVEEQWYIIWPLAMAIIMTWAARPDRARRVWLAVVVAASASAAWMAVLYDPANLNRVYYGTDTRAQQLLVGAALAWLTMTHPRVFVAEGRWRANIAGFALLAGLCAAVVTIDDEAAWLYSGGLLALSFGAAALVALVVTSDRSGALAWLGTRPWVAIGKRSYGLYLWHWPVIVFVGAPMGFDLPAPVLAGLQVAITVMLNEMTYRWVETPARTSNLPSIPIIGGWTGAAVAVSMFAVVTLHAELPRLPNIDVLRPDLNSFTAPPEPIVDGPSEPRKEPTVSPLGTPSKPSPAVNEQPGDRAVVEQVPSAQPRLLLLGDSTALVLAVNRPEVYPSRWQTQSYARVGCAVTDGNTIDVRADQPTLRNIDECSMWYDDWSQVSALYRPDLSVVMIGAWEILDHIVDNRRISFPDPEWFVHVRRGVERAVEAAAVGGADVALLRVPCMAQSDDSLVSARARNDVERVSAFNSIVEAVAETIPGVVTLPLDEVLCPGGISLEAVEGEPTRYDGVHLGTAGSSLVWAWLDEQLATVVDNITR